MSTLVRIKHKCTYRVPFDGQGRGQPGELLTEGAEVLVSDDELANFGDKFEILEPNVDAKKK